MTKAIGIGLDNNKVFHIFIYSSFVAVFWSPKKRRFVFLHGKKDEFDYLFDCFGFEYFKWIFGVIINK